MKNIYIPLFLAIFIAACSAGSDSKQKKKELAEARKEYQALKEKITKLEEELRNSDPEFGKEADKAILVSTFVPGTDVFEHRIDVRGSVASRRNVWISAQTAGKIERVNVREGQAVNKGQVLVSLDAEITQNSIKELKTQLELANTIYERQTRLWEQKVGTEVQYLQAKNNKEALESRLATLNSQLDLAVIRAPFGGIVDELPALEGAMANPGVPLVRLTSPEDMYVSADVSERYLGKIVVGDKVEVEFPIQDRKISSVVSAVSQVINPENRTFRVEVRLPKTDFQTKPNQVTILKIADYIRKDAVAIPTRLVMRDEEGEYVYGVEKSGNETVAKKRRVRTGVTYGGQTEILEGLTGKEELIDKGFRDVADGVHIAVAKVEEIGQVANN
jgi:membrane fusion protein, multidrug efflux system